MRPRGGPAPRSRRANLGAAPADLAFVEDATTGVGIAARSVPLGPGDEALGTDHEYGACARAWEPACASRGATYRAFALPYPYRGGDDFLGRLDAAIGPRTRVPLLVLDGAQAPGQIELDLDALGADFHAGSSILARRLRWREARGCACRSRQSPAFLPHLRRRGRLPGAARHPGRALPRRPGLLLRRARKPGTALRAESYARRGR